MYLLHLWQAVEDVQSTRQHEARARADSQRLTRPARAREHEPGALRRAAAFALIETGLRLLTRRSAVGTRRAR